MQFSPDGKRFALAVQRNKQWRVVVDGQEGAAHDSIVRGSIRFSPDGQRVVYVARRGRHYRLVDNGREGQPYDLVTAATIGPDGKAVAALAVRGPRHVAVVNG